MNFYLHTAYTGEQLLYPHRPPIELGPSTPGYILYPLADETAALAWFDTERPCLLAAERGWHTPVWQPA